MQKRSEVRDCRTDQVSEIEGARCNLDRDTILRHLASESAREWELAMHCVEYLNDNKHFSDELYPILITALADENEAFQHSASCR